MSLLQKESLLIDNYGGFWIQKLTDKIEMSSKLMYLFKILKRESDKLVIEVQKTSLTEITGLSTFNQGG